MLKSKCISCHGPEKQEGGLRLDSSEALVRGGDRGVAIAPGDPDASLLIQAIRFDDPDLQMPPGKKLADVEIDLLTHWVRSGSQWPGMGADGETVDSESFGSAMIDPRNPIRRLFSGERLDLWSLRPVAPSGSGSLMNQPGLIDAFVEKSLAEVNLARSEPADAGTLVRRVTFDLTGLPPSAEEVAAFEKDFSDAAYEHLVDRLLASPGYGERQARLWLDVVRYADTNGYERDEFRPLIWRYRDYVVRSFNQDKPFDQFVREQLAGDLLVSGQPRDRAEADALIATGYLRLGQWDSTAAIFQEADRLQSEVMADVTNTTASAFLGLTYACCQCHDHKYDPLSQADHYRLRAFFAGMAAVDDLVISNATEQGEIEAFNVQVEQQLAPLKARLEELPSDEVAEREQLTARIAELESTRRQMDHAMGVREKESCDPIFVLYQGDFGSPRDEVTPGFPSILGATKIETGRRLALAEWITSRENPWTARVLVNRLWQQHFGVGLVATANDFGFSGASPTHPELLDWLAADLMDHGWSLKRLHRMIVLSHTYRQASRVTEPGRGIDPGNKLLWRQNMRRLDAETLRDTLLAVSGLLRQDYSGKPKWPSVPEELLHAQPAILEALEGKDEGRQQGWYADADSEVHVRSLYLIRKRCLPIPFLQAFDLPDTTVSCARRDTTVVAPQALMLLNSPEMTEYCHGLSRRLLMENSDWSLSDGESSKTLVNCLFAITMGRSATSQESDLAVEFLSKQYHVHHSAKSDCPLERALTDLCRAVMNLNEFAYID
ncbi:MAG: PSD1 and planctomycete cytochrome C domain-containing protein [Planctomycetota bacterium]